MNPKPRHLRLGDRVRATVVVTYGDGWRLAIGAEGQVTVLRGQRGELLAKTGPHMLGVAWDDDRDLPREIAVADVELVQ